MAVPQSVMVRLFTLLDAISGDQTDELALKHEFYELVLDHDLETECERRIISIRFRKN